MAEMADERYVNRWSLDKNSDKRGDKSPDYRGRINVDGVEYYLDGWIKEGRNGKFISGTIKPIVRAEDNPRPASAKAVPRRDDFEDEVPF
jgi:hypothetical protein